jgi:hypothetical protein
MRWIDIDLREAAAQPEAQELLAQAASRQGELPGVQERNGLDSPAVVDAMIETGQLLFQAVTRIVPNAFAPGREADGALEPQVGLVEADHATGFHLVLPPAQLGLPWSWLHTGLDFLLERHALSAATSRSRLAADTNAQPWMQRYRESRLHEGVDGGRPLRETLTRLRPRECADPEILFVPGHCEERIRRLIYREADAIRRALAAGPLDRPLARLRILADVVTPQLLRQRGSLYQGLHFAGPTSCAPAARELQEQAWLAELLATGTTDPVPGESPEQLCGAELDVVGIDPITALLDQVAAGAEGRAAAGRTQPPPATTTATLDHHSWLLEDGPIQPENLGAEGAVPPLVFSNSYLSLPDLGPRFLAAGASAFVGPVAPLYSRPARKFAGRFYNFLADGYSVAAAHRAAALACRDRFGAGHPVWLSYGVLGRGILALQYL